ncbi:hypothetical protein [Planobispora longispora]|uniref:Uncharacterized protein n=1 Tax=Planobispora longispora TaxID=28887 RepID=A0A8J3RPX7_9ACTN|nr:hypothetical protein [Planobispora longispora]GIH77529.1 hypothetical protein Plo01_39580 [Planobispora longispora]
MPGQPMLNTPNTLLGIDATAVVIQENGMPPASVIERNRPFTVGMEFRIEGFIADWLTRLTPSPAFQVVYRFEGQGPAADGDLTRTGTLTAGQKVYGLAGTGLPLPGGLPVPGLYRVSAYVTFGPPTSPPMAAFVEGALLHVI